MEFLGSSVVERTAVNGTVVGSNPAQGGSNEGRVYVVVCFFKKWPFLDRARNYINNTYKDNKTKKRRNM